jgi:hypothetical protein
MSFAPAWLEYGTLFPLLIDEAPDEETGIIVVIPAFDEPSIIELLDSLLFCIPPECSCEVVIIINASEHASAQSLKNNFTSFLDIQEWKRRNRHRFFRLFAINLGQPAIKGWGVGLARKAGMDEAAKRFNLINKPEGIIASLDADCTVRDNYFIALQNELMKRKDRKGCSIYFEHPVSGNSFSENIYNAVYQYELHLRYYFQSLLFTGFPNVFHTVGSSIAVKNLSYIKAGGMNRRQAGEDFYFVQKLVSAGGYFSLNSTTVYPSPRASDRVPFGTGAAVGKMVAKNEKELMTYNPLAFSDLSVFFGYTNKMFHDNSVEMKNLFFEFPESLKIFLGEQEWVQKITEIKENTSGLISFRKRFFDWFNMFRIVKYLNLTHKSIFEKLTVTDAAEKLLKYKRMEPVDINTIDLLEFYRKLERDS